jgi:cytochrome c oxidase subunit III
VLGLAFFLGVVFVEWRLAAHEGLTASFGNPAVGPLGGVFYMMTGMHAFHVLTGLIFLAVVWNNARKGLYTAEKHWGCGSRGGLLALRRPGVDLLLPRFVFDRQGCIN